MTGMFIQSKRPAKRPHIESSVPSLQGSGTVGNRAPPSSFVPGSSASTSSTAVAGPSQRRTSTGRLATPPAQAQPPLTSAPFFRRTAPTSQVLLPSNDFNLKAKLETILSQILQLFRLQSHALEYDASIGSGGTFELEDLHGEDAAQFKELWNEGVKKVREKDRKERESMGQSIVQGMVDLVMLLVDKAGHEVVEKKLENLRLEIERLKRPAAQTTTTNSSIAMVQAPTPTNTNDNGVVPPPAGCSSDPSATANLHSTLNQALSRIQKLEEGLLQSSQEREQLKKDLRDKEALFERRLYALENKTTDPRRRASNGQVVVNGSSGANSSAPTTSTTSMDLKTVPQDLEELISRLRDEAEELKTGLTELKDEKTGKRKRGEGDHEQAGAVDRAAFEKLRDYVYNKTSRTMDLREAYVELQDKIDSLEIPRRNAASHPTNLLKSLERLSDRVLSLPIMTAHQAEVLQGLSLFLMAQEGLSSVDAESFRDLTKKSFEKMQSDLTTALDRVRTLDNEGSTSCASCTTLTTRVNEMSELFQHLERFLAHAYPQYQIPQNSSHLGLELGNQNDTIRNES